MPDTSQAQQRAMYAAKEGHSTLHIPQNVGADFIAADKAAGNAVCHLDDVRLLG